MSLTEAQQEAIAAQGNVVVVAGAGTGKTRTLVERVEHLLYQDPRTSLDEMLIVTFTEAAAAELRRRLRAKLEEQAARDPNHSHWQEQIALFENACIGTLHSFCLRLIREHFHLLELDPQLSVLAEEEARLLADETLRDMFQKFYAGHDRFDEAVQLLIQSQGRDRDNPIRRLVLRLHDYTQTQFDPDAWLVQQVALFETSEPVAWQQWLLEGISDWRNHWAHHLKQVAPTDGALVAQCSKILSQLPARADRSQAAAALETILQAEEDCAAGKQSRGQDRLKSFFQSVRFLLSVAQISQPGPAPGSTVADPLIEDWGWVRLQMTTLLQLVQQFTGNFTEAKRELGVVDFHDLEQQALKLLWNAKTNQPTQIAHAWRQKLRFVFVDEYQDINAAQDKIVEALSRQEAQPNRFLVGDVKQSIYRFRLANPYIFQRYVQKWSGGGGKVVSLVDNFRSRKGILHFVNAFFSAFMRRELGGVDYDENVRLRFGATTERSALAATDDSAPCVELHLRINRAGGDGETEHPESESLAALVELEEAAKEARLVGLRLRALKAAEHRIWDETARRFRPVDWQDMTILLRAPANKAESYAKEFSRLGLPLQVARKGFYRSWEVSDLLSLLQILDNPLQDLPLLAVLHSPLVGLTINELACVRLSATKAHFWTALTRWAAGQGPADTQAKVSRFLDRFAHWRRLARQLSLSRCLEAVLSETHYADWLLTLPQGEGRNANVQRLVAMAQQFDQFQRQGLFRFLRFVEAQQEAETEPEVAALSEQNAIRLMSIHQSKGLEFPVVVVADLGKPFNFRDLSAEIILDEKYGLCPHVKPPHTGSRYPSLPYWLARRRQTRELLGEELRLLYVATTRARDLLILSGAISRSKLNRLHQEQIKRDAAVVKPAAPSGPAVQEQVEQSGPTLEPRSYMDWLGPWFFGNVGSTRAMADQGQTSLLRWFVRNDTHLVDDEEQLSTPDQPPALNADPAALQKLQERLAWQYSFAPATRHPAKLSVSALRRRANLNEDEATPMPPVRLPARRRRRQTPTSKSTRAAADLVDPLLDEQGPDPAGHASAADIGLANHRFLQLVSIDHVDSVAALVLESGRLKQSGALTDKESRLLDFEGLAAFWNSELGGRVRARAQFVRRELAFTARFRPSELVEFSHQLAEPVLDQEYIIVRGAADLAVIMPKEIWLIDFKTDAIRKGELPNKVEQYESQLKLYARALSAIYRRPVSESWLYFLAARQAARIDAPGAGKPAHGT